MDFSLLVPMPTQNVASRTACNCHLDKSETHMDTGYIASENAARRARAERVTLLQASADLIAMLRGFFADMTDLVAAETKEALEGMRSAFVFAAVGALLVAFGSIMLLAFLTLLLMLVVPPIVAVGILVVVAFAGGLLFLWTAKKKAAPTLFAATRRQLRID